jgi:hypothetical protein
MKDLLKDLYDFVKERRNYIVFPLFVTLLLVGTLIIVVQSSAIPLIYTLF